MKPKVSVIIPCYNCRAHIEETLKSVHTQTHTNIETIIIDDGSKDGSFDYLNNLKLQNLTVKKNKGQGACSARNYGFQLSTGDYIQFLDADDLLSSDKIEKQIEAIKNHPNHIAVCSTYHFRQTIEDSVVTDRDFLYSTDQPVDFLLNLYGANGKTNMVQTSAWLTPRHLIEKAGPWDERLSKDQDGEFFCRVLLQSKGVCYVQDVQNYYRKHIQGHNVASQKQLKHVQSQLQALASKESELQKYTTSDEFHRAMALQYKMIAIDTWPEFKQVSSDAMQKVKAHGGSSFVPVLGGKIVETIKSIFGWKLARSFTHHAHKIIS